MTIAAVQITEKGLTNVQAYLEESQRKLSDLTPPLQEGGKRMLTSIRDNFNKSGRPIPWKPLALSTLKQRFRYAGLGSYKPLIKTGALRASITYDTEGGMKLLVGTSISNKGYNYGNIHQFGGVAGRNRSAIIPARPFLLFQKEDIKRLNQLIIDYVTRTERFSSFGGSV